MQIAFLDDEPLLCELFVELFSDETIQIAAFTDAREFLNHVRNHRPDAVFLDYRLRGTTGDRVAAQLPMDIPKFLVTGEIDAANGRWTGIFNRVFEKPIIVAEIRSLLRSLLKLPDLTRPSV